jgi:hypothetical protein
MTTHLSLEACRELTRILDAGADTLAALGRMVTDLELFHSRLEAVPPEVSAELYTHWVALEQVFAVSLDRGLKAVDDEGAQIVREAVSALRGFATGTAETADE